MTDVFDNTQQTQQTANHQEVKTVSLDELVGEGKKYKTQEEALASVPHAQAHISKLEQELSDMRSKLDQAKGVEEILARLEGREGKPPITEVTEPLKQNTPTEGFTEERAKEIYQRMRADEQREANIMQANELAVKLFGVSATVKLQERALKLGMTLEDMRNIAARSPAAFASLIGEGTQASQHTDVTIPDQHRDASRATTTQGIKHGHQSYYEEMRKSDPKKYWSREVQAQMHRDAQQYGESFFQN